MLVLVADDEELVATVLVEFLQELGHTTWSAPDGETALEKLRIARYDLLITDIRMPRMNGAELISAVAVEFPTLLVVVITGYASAEMRAAIRQTGAMVIGMLQKPFEFAQLEGYVDQAAAVTRAA